MTNKEKETLELYTKCASYREVARIMKVDESTVRRRINNLERKGEAPWLSPAPNPEHLSMGKTTVQYDREGKVMQEWRRLSPQFESFKMLATALCDQVRGKSKVPKFPKKKGVDEDTLFELDIYDAHVGMYADEIETLDSDYDCEIAARCMRDAAAGILAHAQKPGKVVVVFGGDMMHADNRSNKTEHSGHVLDVDTRYARVVRYLRSVCQDVVGMAAKTAPEVEVVVVEGNHDWHSCIWLAQLLDAYFSNSENVNVRLQDSPRKYLQWGDCMLVWSHGERIAAAKWPAIIAAENAVLWGATKFRHLKMGHVHHGKVIAPVSVEEQAGIKVEYLPALCPSDAWHVGAGFVGTQKGATGRLYHKSRGEIASYFEPALFE